MDGVLVDSGEFHYQAWSETLFQHGIPFSRALFQETFGMNNRGILTVLLGHPPEPEIHDEISDQKEMKYRQSIRGKIELLPGVEIWLDQLNQNDVPQAVASSAPMANIDAVLDALNIRKYFQAIISAFNLPGKPDPAVFLQAADHIKIEPEKCIVVEDAIAGVKAAKRAGMICIAVTTTNPASALQNADLVVDNLANIPIEICLELLKSQR